MIPLAAMMAASTGLNVAGSILSGYEQYASFDRQKTQEEFAAFQAQKQGELNRDVLLERGRKVEGTARTQLATEGFDFNSGTGAVILNEIVQNSQTAAMSAMLEGRVAAIQHQYNADIAKTSKKQTLINTALNIASTVAGGASNMASAKKKGLFA